MYIIRNLVSSELEIGQCRVRINDDNNIEIFLQVSRETYKFVIIFYNDIPGENVRSPVKYSITFTKIRAK